MKDVHARFEYCWNQMSIFLSMLRLPVIITLIFLLVSYAGLAQNNRGEILDTIDFKGRPVVLLSNYQWKYLSDYKKYGGYDSVFNVNWITSGIHAYGSARKNIPHDEKLNLLEHGSFVFPLDSFKYLRGFTGYHTGVDLKANKGTPVKSAFDGIVRFTANTSDGYGKLVIIRHYNGLETYYAHLSKIMVATDDPVSAGTVIGLVGQTGHATTNHLHFETRFRDNPFSPSAIFNYENRQLQSDSLFIDAGLFAINSTHKSLVGKGNDELTIYTIKKGDTLSKIALEYNTSVKSLCEANHITANAILKIGDNLYIK